MIKKHIFKEKTKMCFFIFKIQLYKKHIIRHKKVSSIAKITILSVNKIIYNNSRSLSKNDSSPHVFTLKNIAWLPPDVIAER